MLWLALVLGSLGCDRERDCAFGAEHEVVTTSAKVIDAIALVPAARGALVLHSEPSGLFARMLASDGRVAGAPVRLGDRCAGGLDALGEPGEITVACLVRPYGGRIGASPPLALGVRLYVLSVQGERVTSPSSRNFFPVGSSSEGVALARADGGSAVWIAWHEGTAEAQRIWLARVDPTSR
jgi:hypothetical protein